LKNTSYIVVYDNVYGAAEKSWFLASLVSRYSLSSKAILPYLTADLIIDFRDCKYVLYCMEGANNGNW